MAIYKSLSVFFLLLIGKYSYGAEDLASFCFESNVSLSNVKQSISFILLPEDRLSLRPEDNCLDIVTTPSRKTILNKFLSRKYNLLNSEEPTLTPERSECRLEFKTTTKKKTNSNAANIGQKNNLVTTSGNSIAVSTTELLLMAGRPGTLNINAQMVMPDKSLLDISQNLQVECRPLPHDNFELIFYFDAKDKATVSTTVQLKRGESLNIAGIKNTLDDKVKTLGIPQTTLGNTQSNEDISYDLKLN
jgi:hypothetical protein